MCRKITVFVLLTLLFGFCHYAVAQSPEGVAVATWNVRNLSSASRDDAELSKIARMIAGFDIVAIQEVRDYQVLDRLEAMLPGWDYMASSQVGRTQKEIYAFFWNTGRVWPIGQGAVMDDAQDYFIREPFAATFQAGEFDFTLCTIHLLYGKSSAERREELVFMDDVATVVQAANGQEQDVILLGDFNFPPADQGWEMGGWKFLFGPPLKTTIGDKSLYLRFQRLCGDRNLEVVLLAGKAGHHSAQRDDAVVLSGSKDPRATAALAVAVRRRLGCEVWVCKDTVPSQPVCEEPDPQDCGPRFESQRKNVCRERLEYVRVVIRKVFLAAQKRF